jgi:hypothetical protein
MLINIPKLEVCTKKQRFRMVKLYFNLFFLIFLFNSRAEYILVQTKFENNKFNIFSVNHNEVNYKIWDILNTMQFPQNLNKYFFSLHYDNSISKSLSIQDQEYLYLKEMIDKYLPDNVSFDLLYIPTSIFEVFSIGLKPHPINFNKTDYDITGVPRTPNKFSKKIEDIISINFDELLGTNKVSVQTIKDKNSDYLTFLLHKSMSTTFAKKRANINKLVSSLLMNKSYIKNKSNQPVSILEILPNFLEYTKKLFLSKVDFWEYMDRSTDIYNQTNPQNEKSTKRKIAKDLIDRIAKIETESYYKNMYPLYRGEVNVSRILDHIKRVKIKEVKRPYFISQLLKENKVMHDDDVKFYEAEDYETAAYSVSYGASLFGGLYYDKTACSIFYMMDEKSISSYILPMSKKYLASKKSIYYLPTIPLLLSHHVEGELFHVRTKVSIEEDIKNNLIKNYSDIFNIKDKGPLHYLTLSLIRGLSLGELYYDYDIFVSIMNTNLSTSELSKIHNYHLMNRILVRK